MFSHVIFDLDGTLLNTIDDLSDAANWVCRRHGWPVHTVGEYKKFVGNGIPKLVERFVPADWQTPERVRQIFAEFTAYYDEHKEDHTAPYPGIPPLLGQLKEAGAVLAVLSNKAHPLAGPMVEHWFPGVFSFVQGALDGVPTKPDPTLLYRLMEKMGASWEDTLFVGDSNVDIQTARSGGLASCGVLWGFRSRAELAREGAGYLVETTEELREVILGHEP